MSAAVLAAVCVGFALAALQSRGPSRLDALRVPGITSSGGEHSRRRLQVPRLRRPDHRLDVVRLADAWAGELGAGRPAVAALERALANGPTPMVTAARRVATGADPARTLNGLATLPGAQGARALSACWVIAATGGALSTTVERTADALRDELALRAEVRAQIAAPRATARLLAVMPLVGPLLGALVGANTIGVLFSTSSGRALLIGGLTLNALGWWWVHRLVRTAERAA